MGNACSSDKAVDVEPAESPRPAPIYVAGSGLPQHTARVPLSKSRSESNLNKRKHKHSSASNSKETSQVSQSSRRESREHRHHSSRSRDPNQSSKSRSQPGSAQGTVRGTASSVSAQGDPNRLTRAKSKKKLATVVLDGHKVKVSLKKSHCIFWRAGKCNWGVACKYLHEGVPAIQKTLVNPPTLSAGAPVQPSSKAFVDLVFTGTGTPPRSESPVPKGSPRDPPNTSLRDQAAPSAQSHAHSLAPPHAEATTATVTTASSLPPITIVSTHPAPIDISSASAPVHLPSQGPVPHAVAISVSAVERTERPAPQKVHEELKSADSEATEAPASQVVEVSVENPPQSSAADNTPNFVARSSSTDSVQPGGADAVASADESAGVMDAEVDGDGEMVENVPIVISEEAMNDPLLMHHLQSQLEYQNRGPGVSAEETKESALPVSPKKEPRGKAKSGNLSDGEISSEYSESDSDEDSGSGSGSESGPYRTLDSSAPSPAPDAKANSSNLIATVASLHSNLEDGEIKSSNSMAQGLPSSASTANSIEESKDIVPPLVPAAVLATNKSPKIAPRPTTPSRIPVLATRAVSELASPSESSASSGSVARSPSVKYRFSFTRSATASNVRAISTPTPKPAIPVRGSGPSSNSRPNHALTRTQSSPATSRSNTLTRAIPKGSTPNDIASDEPSTPRRRPSQSAALAAPTTPRGSRTQNSADAAPTTPRGSRAQSSADAAPTTPRGSQRQTRPGSSSSGKTPRKAHDDALVSLDHLQHMQPGQLLSPRSKQMINQRAGGSASNTLTGPRNPSDTVGLASPRRTESGRGGAGAKLNRPPSRSGSSRNLADRPKSSINLGLDDDIDSTENAAKFVPFDVVAAGHNAGAQSLQDEKDALTSDPPSAADAPRPAPLDAATPLESGEIGASETDVKIQV